MMFYNGTLTPYEVWMCVWDDGCSEDKDDAFCFAFNEVAHVFEPWVCVRARTSLLLSVILVME